MDPQTELAEQLSDEDAEQLGDWDAEQLSDEDAEQLGDWDAEKWDWVAEQLGDEDAEQLSDEDAEQLGDWDAEQLGWDAEQLGDEDAEQLGDEDEDEDAELLSDEDAEQLSDEDAEQRSDEDAEHNRARIKVAKRFLRPLVRFWLDLNIEDQKLQVRLKQLADKIEKLVDQDFEQQKILKELAEDFLEITSLNVKVSKSMKFQGAEPVVSFINSILQIVQNIHDDEYAEVEKPAMDIFISLKDEILDVHDDLKFLINFIWIVRNWVDVNSLVNVTKYIVMSFTSMCCICFLDDKSLAIEAFHRTEVIDTLRKMVRKGCKHYISREGSVFHLVTTTNIIDERGVGFFDFVIHRLRMLCVPSDGYDSDGNDAASYMVRDVKDQMETTIDELSFLRCNLIDVLQEDQGSVVKEMISLSVSTQHLFLSAGFLIINLNPFRKIPTYACYGLPELLEDIDSLKQEASDLYISNEFFSLSGQLSSIPTSSTSQMQFVDTLIKNLEEVVQAANSIDPLKCQIQTVYQETVSMRKCFGEIIAGDQPGDSKSQMEVLGTLIEQATHQSSNIIDSFLAREGPLWYHKLGMFIVANDIKIVHKEMKAILKKMNISDVVCSVSNPASSLADNNPTDFNSAVPGPKDVMKGVKMEEATNELGVKDAAMEVIELLTRGTTQLKIVSIVGMPGLGKTTLANSVYKHPSINIHFHVRAWCCASQDYERETLLAEILSQFVGETNPSHKVRGEDLAHKLYQNLKGRKYLIVIDDIWDVEVWWDLKETFPDDGNGSRILFTTQHRDVALKSKSIPYDLRLLSSEESCELLWFKIFDTETCPPELSNISKRIARSCKGLPLAVVLMAGILKRTKRREDSWEQVAETVIQSRSSHEKQLGLGVMKLVQHSYKHLPDFLKPCFLYLGTFSEDNSISVSKLIRLWISEGNVQELNLGKKSLEEEAESYLNELIDRSLVMIARRSSKGGVKACRVHDKIRDFCLLKLKEERFVLQEDKFGGALFLHGNLKKQIHSLFYHYRSNRALNNLTEGPVFMGNHPIVREQHSEEGTGNRTNQLGPLDYGFILQYEFLRVLDLRNVRVESSAETRELIMIAKLVHLRYLAIRTRTRIIPSEIGNLRSLETFILTGAFGYIMLPESLWILVSLQNVVMDHGYFNFQDCSKNFYENFCQQDKLQSISWLSLRHGNDAAEEFILRRLTGLKKLGCKISADSWDDSVGCSVSPVLEFLSELESLKLFFSAKVLCPWKFSFPSNLKKLSMSNSQLPWDEISVIGRLPNLEVLKLLNRAFEGQQWDMKDDEFQKLKFLKLDSLDIELWNAFAEQLPCLEQLVVLSCPQLEEIPSSFGEICTLQLIEMKWCSSSAMDSVKQILEVQRDMSNDQLNVTLVG